MLDGLQLNETDASPSILKGNSTLPSSSTQSGRNPLINIRFTHHRPVEGEPLKEHGMNAFPMSKADNIGEPSGCDTNRVILSFATYTLPSKFLGVGF